MEGTNHTKRGLARITAGSPAVRLRLLGLVLTALLGSVLVTWVTQMTWDRVDGLQHEFAVMRADSFYLGVKLRGDLQRMNDSLLRYRLNGSPADYQAFLNEADDLKHWIQINEAHASTKLEKRFFGRVKTAFDDYFVESVQVLEASRSRFGTTKGTIFRDNYEKVQRLSEHIVKQCDTFINDQQQAFDTFLKETEGTLTDFQLWLKVSLGLLLTLAAALVVLAYRGMIMPLRHQLHASQAIIARQEKLASLGVLAAGVAHEIRNPLTAIKFRLFTLNKSLAKLGEDNEDAQVISGEISRLERIVKDFLQFARPSDPQLLNLPAQRVLEEVQELLKSQLEKSNIELKLEVTRPSWVRADNQQIKQVLINLIQNSADSITRDGTITLRVCAPPNRAHLHGGAVAIEVADTGKGIPPEVQKRLFDPFFTTKDGGTGLGLSIAARIVEKHGGELYYQTQQDRGTTFTMVLPRANEHESKPPAN